VVTFPFASGQDPTYVAQDIGNRQGVGIALASAYDPLPEQRQPCDVFDQEVEIQIAAEARKPLQDVSSP
jgi:hypothetical protein